MIVIPAIDLMDGKVVRLRKGKIDDVTVYYDDPLEVVAYFNDLGIKRIHVVDLDAAFSGGRKNNRKVIESIARESKALVEVGGGIRTINDIREMLLIVDKVIVGTMPVKNPAEFDEAVGLFGSRIIAGVDVKSGYVRIAGWVEKSNIEYLPFLNSMREKGIKEAIVTDIDKDGMLDGIDKEFYRDLAMQTKMDIIVSGGVRKAEDIKDMKELEEFGVVGVIVGRAFYEKTLSLEEVMEL